MIVNKCLRSCFFFLLYFPQLGQYLYEPTSYFAFHTPLNFCTGVQVPLRYFPSKSTLKLQIPFSKTKYFGFPPRPALAQLIRLIYPERA